MTFRCCCEIQHEVKEKGLFNEGPGVKFTTSCLGLNTSYGVEAMQRPNPNYRLFKFIYSF
jgi:hypothetical protein